MTNKEIANIVSESLRDWFKKEKWVRISSSGNIAGPCGTSKNKKNPDRCLPKAKAQSLTKGERAATAAKKKKAGKKGKTVVKNTKKATVKKEEYKGKHQGSNYKWPMSQATKDRKEADKFAGSDPKAGSTIKGRGFDWKKNELAGKIKEALDQLKEEKPGLWANIRAKRARGEKPSHKNSNAHKDAVKAGKKINKDK